MRKLPPSLIEFVRSYETITQAVSQAEYPYSDYYWKPVACALLSGRVRARQQDNLPNRTEVERFCKGANFNQHYLVIKDTADPNNFILRCREHGFEVKSF